MDLAEKSVITSIVCIYFNMLKDLKKNKHKNEKYIKETKWNF